MLTRYIEAEVRARLREVPVVALLGPRQAGKTTLATGLSEVGEKQMHYLDLERPSDLAKLSDPELYLKRHEEKLVILDEIQRVPDLFAVLRGLIDERRRRGDRAGHFLVLGSASPALLRQASETLAGRVSYLELAGFRLDEVGMENAERLWLRGGYPDSFLAPSGEASMRWCTDLITSYIERDLPQLGVTAGPIELRRLLSMLAHQQGSLANYAGLGKALGWDQKTVKRYCDLLESLFLLRRLPSWSGNLKKRLVKAPKLYLRDSGLLHSLLGLEGTEDLLGHPVCGHSWEGFCIEQILGACGKSWQASHYRTHAGSEVDLVLEKGERRLAIEIKRTTAPRIGAGLREAKETLKPGTVFVVVPDHADTPYPLQENVLAVSLAEVLAHFQEYGRRG